MLYPFKQRPRKRILPRFSGMHFDQRFQWNCEPGNVSVSRKRSCQVQGTSRQGTYSSGPHSAPMLSSVMEAK